jgi:hypothetical protein
MMFRKMYDEYVADMQRKGMGGIVALFNDYQNVGLASPTTQKSIGNTSTTPSTTTKNKNESPANDNLPCGGASSLTNEVIS